MAEKKTGEPKLLRPLIKSLSFPIGEALEFDVDPSFNEDAPVQIHCKSCRAHLRVGWRYQRLKYWHDPMDWRKAPRAFVVSPHRVLQGTLRAVLDKAPSEPHATVYDQLKRWVMFVNVEARSYDDNAIYVELWKEDDVRAA